MREVDPFEYWESHASAISGLGGLERSPDPRYLFHTRYHEVRSGRARYLVRLNDVQASFGEIAVRVHAWKPDGETNVSLVSGARALLDGDRERDITLPVHFAAQKGVLYALYGYLSEDSDIAASTLEISIDEPEDTGGHLPEPPRSVLAAGLRPDDPRPANALLHYGHIDCRHPVSQSCTADQMNALGLLQTGFFGRGSSEGNDDAIARWSETLCRNALDTYGATEPGLEGLVVAPFSDDGIRQLAGTASVAFLDARSSPQDAHGFFDFLLMPGAFAAEPATPVDAGARWGAVQDWLALLKIGGLAALGVRYRPDSDLVGSSVVADERTVSRNEIGQWSLRLIGSGYSVAPLAFAPVPELVIDSRELAAFVLIVQRS